MSNEPTKKNNKSRDTEILLWLQRRELTRTLLRRSSAFYSGLRRSLRRGHGARLQRIQGTRSVLFGRQDFFCSNKYAKAWWQKRAFVEVNLAHRCNLNLKPSPIRLHRLKGGSTSREYGSLCFEKIFFNLAKATNFYQWRYLALCLHNIVSLVHGHISFVLALQEKFPEWLTWIAWCKLLFRLLL